MPEQLYLSIRSLKQYVTSSNITVFFTPPRSEVHVDAIEELGVDLRLVENRSESFAAFAKDQYYGEKTWLCTLEDDTVVFLDCDTYILGDITALTEGNFEFAARPDADPVRQPAWRELFDRFDRPYLNWMPNAGVLVFKDGVHREIEEDWLQLIAADLKYQHGVNQKEQYALALAVGGYETDKLTPREHVMLWDNEFHPDGVVVHAAKSLEQTIDNPQTFKGSVYVGLQHLMNGRI